MSRVVAWTRARGGVGGRLRLVTDQSLHHERVLEVTDVVAVLGLALVDAWEGHEGDTGSCGDGIKARTEKALMSDALCHTHVCGKHGGSGGRCPSRGTGGR